MFPAHGVQTDLPDVLVIVPFAQGIQAELPAAEYLPAAQIVQTEALDKAKYPPVHCVQVVLVTVL